MKTKQWEGWNIFLNLTKKPSGYWTLEACKEDALKYSSRKEWHDKSVSAYTTAHREGWLEECCKHMKQPSKPTKDGCIWSALKYQNKVEWKKNDSPYYHFAYKHGLIDECCKHMVSSSLKWTLEACKKDALKYSSRTSWSNNNSGGYQAATRHGWIDECCKHIENKNDRKWTLEACKEDALKYSSVRDWKANSGGYSAATTRGWLDECCKHMTPLKKPNGYWTIERCKKDALKYKSRSEWGSKDNGSYDAAHRNRWLDVCCKHMISPYKPRGYWTIERCKKDALKYTSRKKWKSSSGYNAACKNRWIDKCCKHMGKRWDRT